MSKLRHILIVVEVGIVHFCVFDRLFWRMFGLGDGGGLQAPLALQIITAILGAPLMYLLYVLPSGLGMRLWGDDYYLILVLAVSNSVFWGVVVSLLAGWFCRRRARSCPQA